MVPQIKLINGSFNFFAYLHLRHKEWFIYPASPGMLEEDETDTSYLSQDGLPPSYVGRNSSSTDVWTVIVSSGWLLLGRCKTVSSLCTKGSAGDGS